MKKGGCQSGTVRSKDDSVKEEIERETDVKSNIWRSREFRSM